MKSIHITNARICLPNGFLERGEVLVEGRRIVSVGRGLSCSKRSRVIDAENRFLCPGFIDLHLHGGGGADVSDESPSALAAIARAHAANGVTGFLATAYAGSMDEIRSTIRRFNRAAASPKNGAKILGYHLEGPFFNPARRGMYRAEQCRPPKLDEIKELFDLCEGRLRLVSLAPELPGAREAIQYLTRNGVTVSAAHTEADYQITRRAAGWGATHVTHLFNAMRGVHHREPGPAVAALLDERFTVELVADGHHVHPAMIDLVVRLKGSERVVLVSDAMRAAGMPPGEYDLGRFDRVTYRDGTVRGKEGNLASTAMSLNTAVVNLARFAHRPLWEAVRSASLIPARVIGIDKERGSLEAGKRADLCLMDKTGRVSLVMIEGRLVTLDS